MAKEVIIPVFIPHLGCPFQCVFCNQHKISNTSVIPDKESLEALVKSYRASAPRVDGFQLAFYGGSFTGIDNRLQESFLGEAQRLKRKGLIQKIRLSTRPDYIDENVIARLNRYQVDIVELGVQSLDETVLAASCRGHGEKCVYEAVDSLKAAGFALSLQMMLALPEDTPQKAVATARKIAALKPDFVRIYPVAIIKETPLAQLWIQGKYQPWSLDLVVETAAQCADIFEQEKITIIRIGLQAQDNLVLDKDLLGGAYHPALGEMVKGRQKRRQLEQVLVDAPKVQKAIIYYPPKERSQFVGQKKCNHHYLSEKFALTLEFRADETLAAGKFRVVYQ